MNATLSLDPSCSKRTWLARWDRDANDEWRLTSLDRLPVFTDPGFLPAFVAVCRDLQEDAPGWHFVIEKPFVLKGNVSSAALDLVRMSGFVWAVVAMHGGLYTELTAQQWRKRIIMGDGRRMSALRTRNESKAAAKVLAGAWASDAHCGPVETLRMAVRDDAAETVLLGLAYLCPDGYAIAVPGGVA